MLVPKPTLDGVHVLALPMHWCTVPLHHQDPQLSPSLPRSATSLYFHGLLVWVQTLLEKRVVQSRSQPVLMQLHGHHQVQHLQQWKEYHSQRNARAATMHLMWNQFDQWAAHKRWATAPLTQSSTIESSVVHVVDYRPLRPLTVVHGWPAGTALMMLPHKEWMENAGYKSPIM